MLNIKGVFHAAEAVLYTEESTGARGLMSMLDLVSHGVSCRVDA